MKIFYITCLLILCMMFSLNAQTWKEAVIGRNYVTDNDITANKYEFSERIHDYYIDTLARRITLQLRGISANGKYLNNTGQLVMYDPGAGSVKWAKKINFQSSRIQQYGSMIIFTSAGRSFSLDPQTGSNEWEIRNAIYYVNSDHNIGAGYHPTKQNLLQGINLKDGKIVWSRQINREYGWNGLKLLNDSTALLAAAGLHTINMKNGGGWDYDAVTGDKDYGSTVAANAAGLALGLLTGAFVMTTGYDLVRDLVSNTLIEDDLIYFADADKMNCLDTNGGVKWVYPFTKNSLSKSALFSMGDTLYLLNYGFAFMGARKLDYGTPFIKAFDKWNGESVFITEVGGEKTQIVDYMRDDNDIWILLPSNRLIRVSLADGSVVCERLFDPAKYGELHYLVGFGTYEKTYAGFKPLVLGDNDKIYVGNSDTVFEFADEVGEGRIIKVEELYRLCLNTGKYKFLSRKDGTIVIDDEEKEVARFDMSGNVFKVGHRLYEVKNNILTEMDISGFY